MPIIPQGVASLPLSECGKWLSGGTPSKQNADYWGPGLPWVSAKDLKSFRLYDAEDHVTATGAQNGSRVVPPGAILILVRGMTLLQDVPICVSRVPLAFNQDIKAIQPFNHVDADYLAYWLLASKEELLSNVDTASHGTGRLQSETLGKLEVALPDLKTQRAIAGVLAAFDDKLELNRRMNQTLEAMARALFKSWFVDFEPVVAKSEGHPTGHPPELDALFPSEFEDSTMGPVPKGWCVCTIGDLAEVVGGSTPSTSQPEFWDGTHCWATPRDLSRLSNPVLLTTERRITDNGVACIGSGLLPVGTVLMSSRAPIGYFAVAQVPVAINQGFIAMKPKDGIPNLYLLNWVQANQEVILSRANGSTFLEISKSSFRPIEAVRPPQPLLDEFHRLASPWFEQLVTNERETRALTAIRNDLLPRLLSGEVEVFDPAELDVVTGNSRQSSKEPLSL